MLKNVKIMDIFSAFKLWKAKRNLLSYQLRLATVADLDFVMNEVVDGAKNGHYASTLLNPEEQKGLYEQLKNVVHYSHMGRISQRGVEYIFAQLWIYGSSKDNQVGFCLLSEKLPGSVESEMELYKIGVRKDLRGLGHGRRIAELFVTKMPKTVKLYARCYKCSEVMFMLLKEVGFDHVNTTLGGTRELEKRPYIVS